ncbi:MAG: DUF6861 domain-containing protein, partial [Gammaproteobacteria bacterium]
IEELRKKTTNELQNIEKHKQTFDDLKQNFASKKQSLETEKANAHEKTQIARLSNTVENLARDLRNKVEAIKEPIDAAQQNMQNVLRINTSLEKANKTLTEQNAASDLLNKILSTSDNESLKNQMLTLRKNITTNKDKIRDLQVKISLASAIAPNTTREVTATSLLEQLNKYKSLVDDAFSYLSNHDNNNKQPININTLENEITALTTHIQAIQTINNEQYNLGMSNANLIATTCSNEITASHGIFDISQESENHHVLVNHTLESTKFSLTKEIIKKQDAEIQAIDTNPDMAVALENRRKNLIDKISTKENSLRASNTQSNPKLLTKKDIQALIAMYDTAYNATLNSTVLSADDKQANFTTLRKVRNTLNEIKASQLFSAANMNLAESRGAHLNELSNLKHSVQDFNPDKELKDKKTYYQKIVTKEAELIAIELDITDAITENTNIKQTIAHNFKTTIKNTAQELVDMTNKVNAAETNQSMLGKLFRRVFNTPAPAVGATVASIGTAAAGGALVGGTIGASFFGIGAIPGAIVGAAIAGTLTATGLGMLGGLGWFATKATSSSNRETNVKEDKEFKQHLQSLVEPGNQVTQEQTQDINPSQNKRPAYLDNKSKPDTLPSFKTDVSTTFAKGQESSNNQLPAPKTDSDNSPKPG